MRFTPVSEEADRLLDAQLAGIARAYGEVRGDERAGLAEE